jgi:hypothetical protein
MKTSDPAENIRALAASLGIDVLGFAPATEFEGYLLPQSPRRDPRLSLPDARTIVVAGIYIGGLSLARWGYSLYPWGIILPHSNGTSVVGDGQPRRSAVCLTTFPL